MKIAIYSPYLDTAGGGEKYMLTIAEFLSIDHQVDVLLDNHLESLGVANITSKVNSLHGLNLSKINFIKAPFGKNGNFFSRLIFLKKYDFLFYLTDGSIFFSSAKNNVLHFQFPVKGEGGGIWGKIKLSSWKKTIFNSNFTKDYIEKQWRIKGIVVYPPVDVDKFKVQSSKFKVKKNYILSVGRFSKAKKHDILIECFKKMDLKEWSLHLVGGEDDKGYLENLKQKAKSEEIYFYPNAPLDELIKLYSQAKVYWHGAGFSEDDPIRLEHFGITTVEAMAAGCVPIVVNLGGQKEIVEGARSGYLWNTPEELLGYTERIIKDEKLRNSLSRNAKERSKLFSKERFCQEIKKIINF